MLTTQYVNLMKIYPFLVPSRSTFRWGKKTFKEKIALAYSCLFRDKLNLIQVWRRMIFHIVSRIIKVYYLFCFADLLSSDRLLRPTPHLVSADKRRISWVPYSYIKFNFRLPLGRTCFLYNRVCNNTSENAFIRSNSYETSTAWNIIFSPVW